MLKISFASWARTPSASEKREIMTIIEKPENKAFFFITPSFSFLILIV
jgi:hypothetical protein